MNGGERTLQIYVEYRENTKHLDNSAERSLNKTKYFCKDIIKDKVRKGRLDPDSGVS